MGKSYVIKHDRLPTAEEREHMVIFLNARTNYSKDWLRKNVYRLMAMYKAEKQKQMKEVDDFIESSCREATPHEQAHFKYENGVLYVLGDNGEYEIYYD